MMLGKIFKVSTKLSIFRGCRPNASKTASITGSNPAVQSFDKSLTGDLPMLRSCVDR